MQWLDLGMKLPITDPTWIFFLVLVIILFAPILLNRLRIPHIVGMILAGVMIGEYGFNILERDSSFELFGKVGLYYIMFLAGLEMNMEDFKSIRTKAIVLGLLAFVIPMTLGFFSNVFILQFGFITSVLLASMYASHTLISYPIVIRYGISRQRSVSIAVGGTAVTDTLTLLVLAVISGMFKEEYSDLFWVWLVAKVVGLSALIIFFFPRIGRWFFRKYDDHVVQFIFVLAMVFLGAGLMELIGMEGILGAFLAGLVLNRLIPHVSPLMHHLEFVGNALFIPYFLIGVGMLIDVRILLAHGGALKVALVMTVMAMISKWIACWATQKIYRMNSLERELMFGLSNAQAAATLAAVLVGYNIILPDGQRLLNDDVLNGTVVLILFTCIISSFVTERAARRVAVKVDCEEMNAEQLEEEKFLIPVSNPETIENLMGMALVMKNPKRKGGFIALNVINDNATSQSDTMNGKRQLERAAMIATSAGVTLNMVTRFDLNIASGIVHTLKEVNASEVVIGLHRKATLVDSFLGNMTESLLKGTHKQVMIVKCLMPVNTLRRIVVAVPPKAEFEVGFFKWLERIARMGSQLGCKIHFFAHLDTQRYLEGYMNKNHAGVRSEFSELSTWDDLLLLTKQVNYDHLLVIVSARRGYISYDPSFDRLPHQITRYFSNNSLLVLFPDQYGDPQEMISYADLSQQQESPTYEQVGHWFYKWFKKK